MDGRRSDRAVQSCDKRCGVVVDAETVSVDDSGYWKRS